MPSENSVRRQAEALLGKLLEGRYRISQVIGHGGMGVVYKAHHIHMDREVAIKMILDSGDDYDVARFQQEARAASALKHPSIITVYDFGIADDMFPYMVMDLVEGMSLSEILRVRNSIPVAEALPIFIQLCDGLAHAHKKKIFHRDLKPSNIMIVRDEDNQPQAVILDFGLAKILPTEKREVAKLTQTGTIFGTPHYMSPEQCLGHNTDHRSDVYSLGCIMYEVLTGYSAVQGDNFLQILQFHIGGKPLGFETLNPRARIPPAVERAIFKSLEKKPEDRQQDMTQFKNELLEALGPSRDIPRAPGGDRMSMSVTEAPYDPQTYRPRRRSVSQSTRQPDEQELQLIKEVEQAERMHGANASEMLPYLESLASYYKDVDLFVEAQVVYERILALAIQVFGERSRWVADVREKLGYVCHMQEEFRDAVFHYLQAREIHRQVNTEPTMDLAWVNFFVHQSFSRLELWKDAEKHLREALDICENFCLPRNSDTFVDWCTDAGGFFYNASMDEQAERYYRRGIEVGEQTWGEKHANLLDIYLATAQFYDKINDLKKAEPMFRKAINVAHKSLAPNDERFALVSYKCGKFYFYAGDLEKSKKCFLTTLQIDEKARGEDSVEHIYTLQFLGMVYAKQGDFITADKHLARAIKITFDHEGDSSEKLIDLFIEHGWVLEKLRQFEPAERTLQGALALARKNYGQDQPHQIERPMYELADFYTIRKKYDQAESLLRDLLDLQAQLHGESGKPIARTLRALAEASRVLGKNDAATRYELRARAIEPVNE